MRDDEIELLDKEVEQLVNNAEKEKEREEKEREKEKEKEKEKKEPPAGVRPTRSNSFNRDAHNLRSNLQEGVVLLANLLGEKVSKRVNSH